MLQLLKEPKGQPAEGLHTGLNFELRDPEERVARQRRLRQTRHRSFPEGGNSYRVREEG